MEEKTGIRKELEDIKEMLSEKQKEKRFRLPFKAKVSNRRLKQGYATVQVINENKEVDFKRYPIIDGTVKLEDTFHAVSGEGILTYKGKPFIIQPKGSLNPYNPNGKNETYGQKYVMARMKADFITQAKKWGWGASIFGLVILGIIAYSFIFGN